MLGDSYDGGWRTVATGRLPGTRIRYFTQKRDGCTRTVQNQGVRDSDALSAPQHRVDAPAERHRHAPAGASST